MWRGPRRRCLRREPSATISLQPEDPLVDSQVAVAGAHVPMQESLIVRVTTLSVVASGGRGGYVSWRQS
jgi:hypothetical protein